MRMPLTALSLAALLHAGLTFQAGAEEASSGAAGRDRPSPLVPVDGRLPQIHEDLWMITTEDRFVLTLRRPDGAPVSEPVRAFAHPRLLLSAPEATELLHRLRQDERTSVRILPDVGGRVAFLKQQTHTGLSLAKDHFEPTWLGIGFMVGDGRTTDGASVWYTVVVSHSKATDMAFLYRHTLQGAEVQAVDLAKSIRLNWFTHRSPDGLGFDVALTLPPF